MASTTPAETERVIRQKLEASGQYGKMRAMIMEAALQTVQPSSAASNKSSPGNSLVFAPSPALVEAKATGTTELSVVLEYLRSLGLQYTESVLRLEAGLTAGVPLESSAELKEKFGVTGQETCLSAFVRGAAAVGGATHPDNSAEPAAAAVVVVEEPTMEDHDDDAVSDHHQPGGEDSTYFISNWRKRHFVRHGQVSGQQVQLDRLTDCQTVVLDELDSMTADDCDGGELVIAACEGSVFLRNCKNMTVHVACKQLRTRDCENIDLHIFTTTDPVVEMSHHVHFYPFHLRIPGLCKLFAEARLDAKLNRFVHVYDFTPNEPTLPQPHFQVHFPDHQQIIEDRYASYGTPECPPELEQLLALQLMPAASSESGKNKSYDIKTGAQVWANAGAAAAVPVAAVAAVAVPANGSGKPPVSPAPASTAHTHAGYQDDFDASADEEGEEEEDAEEHSSVHSSSVSDVDDSDEKDKSGSSSSSSGSGSESDDPATAAVGAARQRKALADPAAAAVAAAPTPVTTTAPAGHAAIPGGLDNEEYSSFDDDSDGQDADDKYEVEEDEDDF